jgi:Xaa-Pro aminopeptidase
MQHKEELVVPPATYAARRRKLMDQIGSNSIIIIPSAMPHTRNADNEHIFRQESSFYYLTGFSEPTAVAVLIPGRAGGEYILFNRAHDPHMETFTGAWAGQDGAVAQYGADASHAITDLEKELYPLFKSCEKMYYPIGGCHEFFLTGDKTGINLEELLNKMFRIRRSELFRRQATPFSLHDPAAFIQQMRLIKEPIELALMQEAVDITVQGHMRAMQAKPEDKENEMTLSSAFLREIMRHGTQEVAYPNIVGAGSHSCTLHYEKNDTAIHDGDIVLVDSGAEYQNYASDITRSFPINGTFTPEQRAIYDLVEATQQTCIDAVKPGATLLEIHNLSVKEITKGLIKLGLLKGELDELIEKKAYTKYYMHCVGHWLGLDVHDTQTIVSGQTKFQPGMVLTVEPGIYIAHPDDVDPKWHNIGIRIEDDILVTEEGCRVMSEALPRKAEDIERVLHGWVPPAIAKLGYHPNRFFGKPAVENTTASSQETISATMS